MIGYSVSVDYITVTAPLKSDQDYMLQQVYDHLVFELESHGHEESAARRLGYVGSQISTAFLGGRQDSRMLTASGPLAAKVFDKLQNLHWVGKVTRIDLQCTWLYEEDHENLAAQLCEGVREYQREQSLPNPPSITLIQGFGNGDTLMVGSRSSEKYIRVYDKTREQNQTGPYWMWRWEVELKGKSAIETFKYLSTEHGSAQAILYALTAYLDNRGIMHPWEEISQFAEPKGERPQTSYEKSLEWLRSHVRGTVRKLIQAGLGDDVAEALGLNRADQ